MKYPFASFTAAFLIYFFLIAAFALAIFKKSEMPQVSLTIDAEMIGNVIQHEKSREKTSASGKKLSKENNREEKLEPDEAAHNKESKHIDQKNISQKLAPLHQPLPQIPDDLRYEAFNSFAIARFHIDEQGSVVRVELVKPCNNPKLNQLLLKSLKEWKFQPSKIATTQDIRVNFKVE